MGAKAIKTNIMYSVVGRYMVGSKVSGYHVIGSDGSNEQLTKNQLIRLVFKDKITNCRVQMCNDCPILRGKGIDLAKLPVYDEVTQKLRAGNSLVDTSETDPNKVFGKLSIKARLTENGKTVGYMVEDISGTQKRLSTSRVLELALDGQIGNATILNNDEPTLKGIGCELESLPAIKVKIESSNRKEFIERRETIEKQVAKELKTVTNMANKGTEECPLIEVSVDELMELGKHTMRLNEGLTNNLKNSERAVGIPEIKAGTARLYVQAEGEGNSKLSEFVTTAIKFGKNSGIIMRVMHRGSGRSFDVREKTLTKISEKLALGIMCCGINKRYKNIKGFGIVSIQSNDASSERVYEFE